MKILITGAKGQLGRALQPVLRQHLLFPLAHSQLDITDPAAVRKAIATLHPDLVINAAAYNHVDKAESEPQAAMAGNERGPRNLAEAAAEVSIPVVHVSTDYVFDGRKTEPYTEDDPTHPLSIYGRSKLAGEEAVRKANPKHFIVRTAWVYHIGARNFLTTMLALSKEKEVRATNDQFSSPTYAPHLAAGIEQIIREASFGTYHLANQGAVSRFDQLSFFFQCLGVARPVHPVPSSDFPAPAPRPRYSALTTVRSPRIILPTWKKGIEEFAKEMKNTGVPS